MEWTKFEEDGDGFELVTNGQAHAEDSDPGKIMRVAELTGLTVADAQDLLRSANNDVSTAVALHFEKESRVKPRSRPSTAPVSRPGGPARNEHVADASSRGTGVQPAQHLPPATGDAEPEEDPNLWIAKIRKQAQEASELLRRCENKGEMFVDDLFPAASSSLDGCTGAAEVHRWCRPVETWEEGEPSFFQGAVQADDVVQGRVKDCWFLGALAIVASKPGMLQRLVHFSWVAKGMHAVCFFVEGEWITVVVDDLVPCGAGGTPIFGRCKDPHHVWVQVFEKAFAKLCGSFRAIESGSEDDALVALTGGSPEIVELHADEEELVSGAAWQRLVSEHEAGALMGCANHGRAATSGHIQAHHAYSVLSVLDLQAAAGLQLLQVRNPWGSGEWTGRYSPGSPSWNEIPAGVREMLGRLASREESLQRGKEAAAWQQGGSFFMCFEDFYTHFDRIYMVRLPPTGGYTVTHRGAWGPVTSGGCNNFGSCASNPQFRVLLPHSGALRLRLFQRQPQDAATFRVLSAPLLHIGMYVVGVEGEEASRFALPHVSEEALVGKTASFVNAWQVSVSVYVDDERGGGGAGRGGERAVVVVPCTYNPGCQGEFVLSVWSEQPAVTVERITRRLAQVAVTGEWRAGAAGGCRNNDSWLDNPVAKLRLPQGSAHCELVLKLADDGAQRGEQLRVGLGMYVVRRGGSRGWRDTGAKSDPFMVGVQTSLKLPPGLEAGEYWVVPCTFRPEEYTGAFELALCSPPDVPAALDLHPATAREALAPPEAGLQHLFGLGGRAPPLFQLPVHGREGRRRSGEGWVEGHRGYQGAEEESALQLALALSLSEAER